MKTDLKCFGVALVALLLGGCLVQSIHPLFTEQDYIPAPQLVGAWTQQDENGKVEGVWETKGRIMRCLIQQFTKLRVETLDGIKIYLNDTEWVLIKPDNDTAAFHLVAEARSPQAAQEIIADYGGIVHRYVQAPCSDAAAPEPLTPR